MLCFCRIFFPLAFFRSWQLALSFAIAIFKNSFGNKHVDKIQEGEKSPVRICGGGWAGAGARTGEERRSSSISSTVSNVSTLYTGFFFPKLYCKTVLQYLVSFFTLALSQIANDTSGFPGGAMCKAAGRATDWSTIAPHSGSFSCPHQQQGGHLE